MNKHEDYINDLSRVIHQDCVDVGWWDDPNRCLYTCLQLVSTEISEATEGARKDLMDTHLEHYKMEEVEYADALIRLLDFGGRIGLRYMFDHATRQAWCNQCTPIGKQQLGLNAKVVQLAYALQDYEHHPNETYMELMNHVYSDLIVSIIQICHNRGFTLYEAMDEKMQYNRVRSDHKRENRAKAGGKAW